MTDIAVGGPSFGRLARRAAEGLAWLLLVLMVLSFVRHAGESGLTGLAGLPPESEDARFPRPEAPVANFMIFAHMLAGAAITLLAPVQLVGPIRRWLPGLHRALGRIFAVSALATGIGGLVFIALHGTIGGWFMDVGFGLYGLCMVVAAVETARHARARRLALHREWALRLVVLALASWFFRLHYGLWYLTTGGLWRDEDFSGAFDLVQVYAFYVPYLVLIEIYIRATRTPAVRPGA